MYILFSFRISVELKIFESVANYTCEKGFELYPSNFSSLKCGVDHTWGSGDLPTCRRVSCPSPLKISNGFFEIVSELKKSNHIEDDRSYLFEDIIRYNCDQGFEIANKSFGVITCSEEKEWDKTPPTCTPVRCRTPPSQHHGSLLPEFVNQTFSYTQSITYQCKTGYELINNQTTEQLTCSKNGYYFATLLVLR